MTTRLTPESIKEKNHIIWENVRQEGDLNRAKNMIANGSEEAVNDIYKQMSTICTDHVSISRAVFGNGEPSESLVARLKVLETDFKNLKDGFIKLAWGVGIPLAIAIMWALVRLIASYL